MVRNRPPLPVEAIRLQPAGLSSTATAHPRNETTPMKLTHRFGSLSTISIVLLVALSSMAGLFLLQMRGQMREIDQGALQPVTLLARLDAALLASRLQAATGLMHDPANPASKLHDHPTETHAAAVDRALQRLEDATRGLRALDGDPAEVQAWRAIADAADLYARQVGRQTVTALREERWEPLGAAITLSNSGYVALQGRIDAARDTAQAHAGQALAASEATLRRSFTVMAVVLVLSIAGFAGFATASIRAVRRSAQSAKEMADRLGRLDLRPIPVHAARDEIGVLCDSIHRATLALQRSFAEIDQVAGGVRAAANELAAGSTDLSARTEAQAASLEQTASATEQLSATVRNNDGAAREARSVADAAAALAQESGHAMAQAVQTMNRIGASSERIGEIIGVIDGIAFQTNILALNAAVEAARAGEHGRGFAVVASEVRALAGRSAAAAREISQLIGESRTSVQQGIAQVSDTNGALGRLVEQVRSLHRLMEGIVTASAEQASGIAEMSKAVQLLDGTTQQNAALVEQSSASASTLESEARRLQQALAGFTLARG